MAAVLGTAAHIAASDNFLLYFIGGWQFLRRVPAFAGSSNSTAFMRARTDRKAVAAVSRAGGSAGQDREISLAVAHGLICKSPRLPY